jgi:hypothetical protein
VQARASSPRGRRRVAKGQTLRFPPDEGYPFGQFGVRGEAGARPAKHLVALVEADDLTVAAADKLAGDQAGAGGYIEDALPWLRGDRLHQRAPPARVLAEAEERTHPVVAGGQAREQLKRVALAGGGRAVGWCGHQAL